MKTKIFKRLSWFLFGKEIDITKRRAHIVSDFYKDGTPRKTFISRHFNIPYGHVNYGMVAAYKANPNISRNEILSLSTRRYYKSIKAA